jgi:CubicO group peptidase (beta-lactamase class C family)
MKNSYLSTDPRNEKYAIRYFAGPGSAKVKAKISYTPGASSGYASAHDLALFAKLHLKDLISAKEKLLSPSSIDYMQHPGKDSSYSYGLAWWIQNNIYGYKGVLAQGGTTDAQAHLQLIPSEDLAIIVLSNTGRTNCGLIINESISAILPQFKEQRLRASQTTNRSNNNAAPNPLPDFLSGEWKGIIHTFKSDIPIVLSVKDSSSTLMRVGTADPVPVKISFRNGSLS